VQVNAAGTSWVVNNNPQGSLMSFYNIGRVSATSIVGLIVAAQIGSVNATSIVGAIQAGQITSVTAGQITGTLTASQIQSITAGQITGQLTSGQIASVNASTIVGQIAATQISTVNASAIQGTISAGQIASISAGQITGTLAYTQIGTINAATITIGQLQDSQIAGMNGAKLSIGSVASDKFNGYSIDVGGLGNMPGRIRVFSNTGAVVAQMGYLGEVGAGAYGGWFQVFGAGGTAYSNANIYTDTSGNLFVKNANIDILNGSFHLYTSQQTFDPSTSLMALRSDASPDSCSFIARGLVFYYGGSKIGSLVRSPGGAWLELECSNSGGYVLISGQTGTVRADGGFSTAGLQGVTGTFVAGSQTIHVTRGIITGIG